MKEDELVHLEDALDLAATREGQAGGGYQRYGHTEKADESKRVGARLRLLRDGVRSRRALLAAGIPPEKLIDEAKAALAARGRR